MKYVRIYALTDFQIKKSIIKEGLSLKDCYIWWTVRVTMNVGSALHDRFNLMEDQHQNVIIVFVYIHTYSYVLRTSMCKYMHTYSKL